MKSNLVEFCGRLRTPWNLIKTHNINDVRQVQIYRKDQYVWLLNKNVILREKFPLGWIPEKNKKNEIHIFYEMNNDKKTRPVLKLVPTNLKLIKREIHSNIPASYINNIHEIYFIGKDGNNSVIQFKKQKEKLFDSNLIIGASDRTICQKILQIANSKHVWLIDVNLTININFDFNYNATEENTIYEFKPYGFIKLVPIEYIEKRGYGDFKVKQINLAVGQ